MTVNWNWKNIIDRQEIIEIERGTKTHIKGKTGQQQKVKRGLVEKGWSWWGIEGLLLLIISRFVGGSGGEFGIEGLLLLIISRFVGGSGGEFWIEGLLLMQMKNNIRVEDEEKQKQKWCWWLTVTYNGPAI